MKIIECVPNFSCGDCPNFQDSIAQKIASHDGVTLADCSRDADHNRSVFTIIGSPEAVLLATLNACILAVSLIDLREHHGEHPRIGAVDVVPFVPLTDTSLAEAATIAKRFGESFSKATRVPVYYYGAAATAPPRRELSWIRRGGYEALAGKMLLPEWTPDEGVATFNARSGATAVGARFPLVAFNINLDSDDLALAKNIAKAIRQSNGGLAGIQAIGVELKHRKLVQVSTNITDYRRTTMQAVFAAVKARAVGVQIRETELIGIAPRDAFGATPAAILLNNFHPQMILENHLAP
ncbi:MAG: glutamate formimidoyltransferase [Deltaproteobacteria bacterium]|nr:glutamate formimidoyltransferase [Deltaproteobacteria bacterium]